MGDQKRGDDAADHAPRPTPGDTARPAPGKQDAPNYDKREDDGHAVATEDISSANDE